jgi:Tfp pilus assembly protein PilF
MKEKRRKGNKRNDNQAIKKETAPAVTQKKAAVAGDPAGCREGSESGGGSSRRYVWFVAAIILIGILIYSNSFDCSFHFDDSNIFVSSVTRESATIGDWLKLFPSRPLGVASFALNYHFHKMNVWGYHFVNLAIHLANALLIFWLCLLTFSTPVMKDAPVSRHRAWIAFFTAMLFVSHPLATQSVTYIAQRFASLATFFYLLSTVLYVKGRFRTGGGTASWLFYGGTVVSAVLAMLTKEIAFTLPFALLLYEVCFLKTEPWKFDFDRKKGLAVSALIFVIFAVLFFRVFSFKIFDTVPPLKGYNYSISAKEYLFTQFNVLVTYLRLFILPVNQNLDYDYPVSHSLFDGYTLPCLFFLTAIVALGVWAFKRWRLVAFGIFWFFLTMSVESSIIPVSQNVIFEHRTYLSSFGFFLAATSALFYFARERYKQVAVGVLIVLVCAGSVLAYQRNRVWKDEYTLWTDCVKKSPNKGKTLAGLAQALFSRGDIRAALQYFDRSIALSPYYDLLYYNRGSVRYALKDYRGAAADYDAALKINPSHIPSYHNRAYAKIQLGDYTGAAADFEAALKINPGAAETYISLGNLKAQYLKDYAGSIQMFTRAIALEPGNVWPYSNRGFSRLMLNDRKGACEDWRAAAGMGSEPGRRALQIYCRQ